MKAFAGSLFLCSVCVLAGCTLVFIEGDHNAVSDTGWHGGGLTIPAQQTGIAERLRALRDDR